MKKYLMVVMMLLAVSTVYAASLSREAGSRAAPGETFTVTFSITGIEAGQEVAIDEIIPDKFELADWNVEGSKESKGDVTHRAQGNRHTWAFTAATGSPKLTYSIVIPSDANGDYSFNTVYVLPPAKMDNLENVLTVRVIKCGDHVCEGNENSDNCEADCPKQEPVQDVKETIKEVAKSNKVGWIIFMVIVVVGLIVYFAMTKKK